MRRAYATHFSRVGDCGPHQDTWRTHSENTDSFYVLEGEVEFTVEGRTFTGGPGTFVSAPPGVEHTFGKPARGARGC
jgi:quercetin dioxygenase-like cupin family protein